MANFNHIKGTGKPLTLVAPNNCSNFFIMGKEYPVMACIDKNSYRGYTMNIIGENGKTHHVFERGCNYLRGKNWIVTKREA